MTNKPQPLAPVALYTSCDASRLPFKTTAELEPLDQVVGQERAVEAVRFAVGMDHGAYNLFAMGPEGTGKYSLVRRALEDIAAGKPVPDDWCYINNFGNPHRPRALRLPPGRGRHLRDDMARLVEELKGAISVVFESEEYRNRRHVIEEQFKERQEEAFGALQKSAEEHDTTLIRTPVGMALAPARDGEVLSPQEFDDLSDEEKKRRKAAMESLQKRMEETLRDIPKWEREQRQQVRDLNREIATYAAGHLIDDLKKKWEDVPAVHDYLDAVHGDVVENVADFLPREQPSLEARVAAMAGRGGDEPASFRRYQINVLVDQSSPPAETGNGDGAQPESEGAGLPSCAPVVYEDHPTQPNLIGRIEHLTQFGTLVTDFNLIKPGALHRANGGALILDARKLLMQPFAWETLLRALRGQRIRIESPAESLGWVSTVTLEPEPIPLDLKVVLMGEPILYYLLGHYEPDFRELFKVAADFGTRMDRTDDGALQYGRLIAAVAAREDLKPMDAGAVARIVEHGARLADDAEKLTTHMGTIVDLVREADYWAGEAGAETVAAAHVQKAIDAKIYRSDRIRQDIQEAIERGTLVIETDGVATGQVNGLSVIQLDHFAFGRPSRISCRVRMGKGEVLDIEREVALGGPLHSKGVMILASYLSTRFAGDQPLSLTASLVFEQSYGGVEGDSASSAELYALLSALAEVPVRQSLAVTGSVDQHGRVQAIGGVNEKIEGFFDVCAARGLTGDQGVLIPAANIRHLMLRADVVEAAGAGTFHIYAVETIDQGIEILAGQTAGLPDDKGRYPIGSLNGAVARRLAAFAAKARSFAAPPRRRRLPGRPDKGERDK
jgi:lon-related putative ATP-dependent protease